MQACPAHRAESDVGRYEIVRQIGRGGMAIVYLARQQDLDRDVALKELSSFHATAPDMTERFVRESRLAGSLNHPNIVTVLEYFEDGGPYIAMEYVPRGSLRPYVGRLSPAQLAGVMEGVLAGLAHAEMHGIVHRDLKPENLMVTSDGRVKIADFGIAKATQSAATGAFLTAKGTTVGTPAYMAPEQAMGQEVGTWSDLYSVGVMAWEQVVGRTPFHDTEAPMAVLMRHVNEPIPPTVEVKPDADPQMSEWIDRLLVKDAAKRTRSPTSAWEEFEEIVISQLGPRWRRDARLPSYTEVMDTPKPLTPAPFESTHTPTPEPMARATDEPAEAAASGYLTFGQQAEPDVAPETVAPAAAEEPEHVTEPEVPVVSEPRPEPAAREEPRDATYMTFGSAAEPASVEPAVADKPAVESEPPLAEDSPPSPLRPTSRWCCAPARAGTATRARAGG